MLAFRKIFMHGMSTSLEDRLNTKLPSCRETLRAYYQLRSQSVTPPVSFYLTALKACTALKDVQTGRLIHADLLGPTGRRTPTIRVATTLVDMYSKCGSIEEARGVFDGMTEHDVVSWNAFIMGYVQAGKSELAFKLFWRMQEEGFVPNDRTYVAALTACSCSASKGEDRRAWLENGRAVHRQLAGRNEYDKFVANALIDMYSKCGCVESAREVFERMAPHDVVAWNSIIMGYAQNGNATVALELFQRMDREGCEPNARTYVAAIHACSVLAMTDQGSEGVVERSGEIHSRLLKTSYIQDEYVTSSLVDMYCKLGSMSEAQEVFTSMSQRTLVAWNTLIRGYVQSGENRVVLELGERMQREGFVPDGRTIVSLLNACTALAEREDLTLVEGKLLKAASLEKGMCFHARAVKTGCEHDPFVVSALIDMYSRCGAMVEARKVFDKAPCRDTAVWNSLILGYSQGGDSRLALDLFKRMQEEGLEPDCRTFIVVLNACINLDGESSGEGLRRGVEIHRQVAKLGLDKDVLVSATVVDMYCKCASVQEAQAVFDGASQRDTASWNALMRGYVQCGEPEVAIRLFLRMNDKGLPPNSRTFIAALSACTCLAERDEPSRRKAVEQAGLLHSQLASTGFETDVFVASTLIDMFSKLGDINEARKVFDKLPEPDIVSWNSIITGYSQIEGHEQDALELFSRMQDNGLEPNSRTYIAALNACIGLAAKEEGRCIRGSSTLYKLASLEKGFYIHSRLANNGYETGVFVASSLVDLYSKCGSLVDARNVFDRIMKVSAGMDVVLWTSIISGYAQNGESELALELFQEMEQHGLEPDVLTYIALLKACASLTKLELGRFVHSEVVRRGFETALAVSSVISFYGKCGSVEVAKFIFDSTQHTKDPLTWSSLIAGYSHQGDHRRALETFREMTEGEGLKPDGITFLSLLNVCSHAGLVDKGRKYFEMMSLEYGISPGVEHYACMVDLLGRANYLDEAVEMVKTMPVEPSYKLWVSLLGSCKKWGDVRAGEMVFQHVMQLENKDGAAFVLMANMYAEIKT